MTRAPIGQGVGVLAKTVLSLDSKLPFGKYKGLTVRAVIRFNPRYLGWAANNVDWIDFDAEARKAGQRAINKEREFSVNQMDAWAHGFGRDARDGRRKHDLRMARIEREERAKAGQDTQP